MNEPLILASASPRRAGLLTGHGYRFVADPPHVDESFDPALNAAQNAVAVAARKGEACGTAHGGAVVLAADTIVVLDGALLVKPVDEADAVRMLTRLSGRTHEVITGVALLNGHRRWLHAERSSVTFSPLDAATIERYVATGEPMDKAGGYALQGLGGELVRRFDGSRTNIIGLPMEPLVPALASFGIHPEPVLR